MVAQDTGVEALAEPVVDLGQHRARYVALALLRQQPCKAGGGAQFPMTSLSGGAKYRSRRGSIRNHIELARRICDGFRGRAGLKPVKMAASLRRPMPMMTSSA